MNRLIKLTSLAGMLALPLLLAPLAANATCVERKTAGTVIGGVGGAVVGNSISHGGTGAVLGGIGGALLGHHVASGAGGCRQAQARYDGRGDYRDRHHHHRYAHNQRRHEDQYGNPN